MVTVDRIILLSLGRPNLVSHGISVSKMTAQAQSLDSESSGAVSPLHAWAISVGLGILLALGAVFFINLYAFIPLDEIDLSAVQLPRVSTGFVLAFYAVVATVVVALAFTARSYQVGLELNSEEMVKRDQENTLVLLAALFISVSTVATATLHTLSRWMARPSNMATEDVLRVFAVLGIAALLSLIGSLVRPSNEQLAVQALVTLPKTEHKIQKVTERINKIVGAMPKRLSPREKAVLVSVHLLWPLGSIMLAALVLRYLWSDIGIPSWTTVPLTSAALFLMLTFQFVLIASLGWLWPFLVIRLIAILFFCLAIVDLSFALQGVDGPPDLVRRAVLSLTFSTCILGAVVLPWVIQKRPRNALRTNIFLHHVYLLRVHIFAELIRGLLRHKAKQENRAALLEKRVHEKTFESQPETEAKATKRILPLLIATGVGVSVGWLTRKRQ